MAVGYFTVPAPTPEPYRYGLLSAAHLVTDNSAHWRLGLQYDTDACATGGIWDPRCTDPFTVTLTRTANANEFRVELVPAVGPYEMSVDGGAFAPVVDGATFVETTNPFTVIVRETTGLGRSVTISGIDPTSAQGTQYTGASSSFAPNDPKAAPGLAVGTADAFVVYAGVDCRIVGLVDSAAKARRRLEFVERRLVEERVWVQQLAVPSAVLPTGSTTAVSLKEGIAALEEALGDSYGGIGIIHSPEWLTPYLSDRKQIVPDGAKLRTSLGTKWAFGRGYLNTDPDGVAATTGTAWLYATGDAVVRRSEMLPVIDERSGATDLSINDALIIAERSYAVILDCVLFAVHVTLEGE